MSVCHRLDPFVLESRFTLQHTATHCNTLQHTATHATHLFLWVSESLFLSLGVLQHTATHCNTLQHTAILCNTLVSLSHFLWVSQSSNTLQHTATHCNTLQHTRVSESLSHFLWVSQSSNTLQHIATHCNTLVSLSLWVPFSESLSPLTHCNTLQHTATLVSLSLWVLWRGESRLDRRKFRLQETHENLVTRCSSRKRRVWRWASRLEKSESEDESVISTLIFLSPQWEILKSHDCRADFGEFLPVQSSPLPLLSPHTQPLARNSQKSAL